MKWRQFTVVALTQQLVLPVLGYGTTISIAISYCPATYTSTSTSTTSSLASSPSSGPAIPYYLFLADSLGGEPEYIAADGTISTDPRLAVAFTITPSGQLMSGRDYVSTSGELPSQKFEVSPVLAELATVFSVATNNTLVWTNDVFAGRQALFCVFGSVVQVVFDGQAPPGCTVTLVNVIPVAEVGSSSTSSISESQPSSLSTTLASSSQMTSTTASLSTGLLSTSTTSLQTSPATSLAASSQTANPPTPPSPTTASPYSIPTLQSSSSTSPGTTAYPSPTTTGVPNCFDRSPFDGTVNGNYLILCDTDLPGFDLDAVPASDIADCIDACNSYVPGSEGPCIAVEFDILAASNPCQLKFDIGVVNRGANAFAQAAIIVNQPYAPQIVFADNGSSASDTVILESSTTTSSVSVTTPELTTSGTSGGSPLPDTSSPSLTTTMSSARSNPTSAPATTQQTSISPIGGGSSSTTTSSPGSRSGAAGSSVATASTTNQQPSNAATSSSLSSRSAPSSSASTTAASTPALPTTLSATTPSSLQSTTVSRTGGTSTTTSSSSSNSSSNTSQTTTLTTTSPQTSVRSTTLPLTSTSTSPYCSASPTTSALCPTYNHQALNVNSDGVCYEVECSTTLQGNILNGNSTTASSLKTCLGFCTLYNIALPYGCVGVNYLGSTTGSSPNCILLSSITSTTYSPGIDSGRLLFPGYPSITDPMLGTTSTSTRTATTTVPATISTNTISTSVSTSTSVSVSISRATTISTSTSTSSTTTTTTTTSYSPLSCAPAPSASACPGTPPATCYDYNIYGSDVNYEIECATSFTGAVIQPLIAFSLEDCIGWCQYQNLLQTNSCLGLTFQEGATGQGTANNCFRYSSLTCATRGNATFDSARMLYSGYPRMTDYTDPSFVCPT